jgi:hypothetical protein
MMTSDKFQISDLKFQNSNFKFEMPDFKHQTNTKSNKKSGHLFASAGSEQDDHLVGEGAGDGRGAAETAAAVAGLVGLKVSLVVLVELDFAAGGHLDPLFDALVGLLLRHGRASCAITTDGQTASSLELSGGRENAAYDPGPVS